ncbi:hypothetical protein [Halobacillus sp. Marseille-Q1614]|uniref:hypothetical protein n=1 Tax=Halobacillus sp. Marseille-Q1614 TaxID=2709134 RepID=UPI00156D628C|nr:hypothetical protein [Halobacillus sp. Marseille-Q1614]
MDWYLIVIPVVTTLFTYFSLYLKEALQHKKETQRTITESKLVELYNQLFSYSLKYTDRLDKSFYTVPQNLFYLDGEFTSDGDVHVVNDPEYWDGVIDEIRCKIHEKLHLLDHDDLEVWHQLELLELEEKWTKELTLNVEKYKLLLEFFKIIQRKYERLYKEYHAKD